MSLFIKLSEYNCIGNDIEIVGDKFHHLAHVKRVKVGDEVSVSPDQSSKLHLGVISDITDTSILVKIIKTTDTNTYTDTKLTLGMCIIKGEKMDLVIQKATEVGIDRIIPLISKRTVVKLDNKNTQNKLTRYSKIAGSAAEQSERTTVPIIDSPVSLPQLLTDVDNGTLILFFYERNGQKIKDIKDKVSSFSDVLLLIGPEGGWDEAESDMIMKCGAIPVSLGDNILRAETAAIVASFTIKNLQSI